MHTPRRRPLSSQQTVGRSAPSGLRCFHPLPSGSSAAAKWYLSPPDNAIVVSLDEKTSIQAREQIRKELPMQPGKPARRELKYEHHGVQALLAALLVHTGEVIGNVYDRNPRVEFLDFLDQLERQVPAGKEVHAILDNLQVHKTPEVPQWLDDHPR